MNLRKDFIWGSCLLYVILGLLLLIACVIVPNL